MGLVGLLWGTVPVRLTKGGNCPYPRTTQLRLWLPLSLPGPLYQGSRQLTPLQCLNSAGGGNWESRGWAVAFPQADIVWRGVLGLKKDGICVQCRRQTQHRHHGALPFSSLPRATLPSLSLNDFIPLCASLPPLELRVSCWEQDFVCWPFNNVPGFLAESSLSLQTESADLPSQMLCGHLFSALLLWAGEPGLELRPHAPRGSLCCWDMRLNY